MNATHSPPPSASSPSPEHLALCVNAALALPTSKACNLRLVSQGNGEAVCQMDVTEAVCAGTGALSGADLYGLLDLIGYLAVTTQLSDEEAAVSHDAHFSLMSTAPLGSVVEVRSAVQRRGRALAFIRVDAFVLGSPSPKHLAMATVTKSLISTEQRMRHRQKA
jgi:acyl-coenzyme A thioesterase PaaI-like protein